MQVSLSTEYLTWDNTQQVTHLSSRATGPVATVVATAKVRALTTKELAASDGVYQGGDVAILLPAALISGDQPKPADQVVTGDGAVYTALEVAGWKRDSSGKPTTWRLVARNLAVQFRLADTIDVQRAALTYDAAGGIVRHWPDGNAPGVDHGGSTPYAGIAARCQLLTKEQRIERGIRGQQEAYAVIIDRQVLLTAEDRVKWTRPDGVLYLDIDRLHNPQRVDELPVLDCRRAV